MYRITAALFFILFLTGGLLAQNSFGFRAGLNMNSFSGDLEPGESYDSNTGFHIGFSFSRNFTDIWGVRGEFVYNQKGGQVKYDGNSFLTLKDRNDRAITHPGTMKSSLSVSNTYLDFPITGFGRLANWVEVSVGVVPGFLVVSRAAGDIDFSSSELNSPVSLSLDYDFYSDKAGETVAGSELIEVKERATANTLTIPSMPGAYYFQDEKDGSRYNVFNLDAVVGVSIFVNQGLYIGGRLQYGLLDVTNDKADYAFSEENTLRSDKDVNLIYQASVGFNF